MRNMILILLLALFSLMDATTLIVAQDGSGDYTDIQSAINVSADGDTVLVHPGTYYENVTYDGHNITLASLELTTGDSQYIHTTIIDGNHQNSCVRIIGAYGGATLRGFTLIHGSGSPYYNGTTTGGGGVFAYSTGDVQLINCQIKYNAATHGGGAFFYYSGGVFLSGTSIHDNQGSPGGLFFNDQIDPIEFDAENYCCVYNNWGASPDIYCMNINECHVILDTFSVVQPQHYYANYGWWRTAYENHDPYSFDIQHGYLEPINHDLYVSPNGNDNNDGLSVATPLKNIAVALHRIESDSLNPKTVHLAEGTYNLWDGECYYMVVIKQYVNIIGSGMELTIIDANGYNCAASMLRESGDNLLKDFCVQGVSTQSNSAAINCYRSANTIFRNLIVRNNTTDSHAGHHFNHGENVLYQNVHFLGNVSTGWYGGMEFEGKDVTFDGCVFDGNIAGGYEEVARSALYCDYIQGDLILRNCIFRNNGSSGNSQDDRIVLLDLHPLYEEESRIIVENNLFYNNELENGIIFRVTNGEGEAHFAGNTFVNNSTPVAILSQYGGGEYYNNIVWDNHDYEYLFSISDAAPYNDVILDYNDIEDGLENVYHYNGSAYLLWGEHNLDIDPQFSSQFGYEYMLSADSPLIDQGQPEPWEELFPYDLIGNERIWDGDGDDIARLDIGCCEYQYMVAPEELSAVQEGQDVLLTWDHPVRSLHHWNVYRDSTWIDLSSPENGTEYYDRDAPTGDHTYYVTAQYGNIESTPSNTVPINVLSAEDGIPKPAFRQSNHPNPFNPETTISYSIPEKDTVEIDVYNVRGQKVASLLHETQEAGEHSVVWSGEDNIGKACSSGIYYYKITAGSRTTTRKMLLLK